MCKLYKDFPKDFWKRTYPFSFSEFLKARDFTIDETIVPKELMQVCYDIDSYQTEKREIKPLIKVANETGCDKLTILTWGYESEDVTNGKKIIYLPL